MINTNQYLDTMRSMNSKRRRSSIIPAVNTWLIRVGNQFLTKNGKLSSNIEDAALFSGKSNAKGTKDQLIRNAKVNKNFIRIELYATHLLKEVSHDT